LPLPAISARPALLKNLGSKAGLWLWAKAGCHEIQPGRRPYLFSGTGFNQHPFPQAEPPGKYIIFIFSKKSRGREVFKNKFLERKERGIFGFKGEGLSGGSYSANRPRAGVGLQLMGPAHPTF